MKIEFNISANPNNTLSLIQIMNFDNNPQNSKYLHPDQFISQLKAGEVNLVMAKLGAGKTTAMINMINKFTNHVLKTKVAVGLITNAQIFKTTGIKTEYMISDLVESYAKFAEENTPVFKDESAQTIKTTTLDIIRKKAAQDFADVPLVVEEFDSYWKYAFAADAKLKDGCVKIKYDESVKHVETTITTVAVLEAILEGAKTTGLVIGFTGTDRDYEGFKVVEIECETETTTKINKFFVINTANLTSGDAKSLAIAHKVAEEIAAGRKVIIHAPVKHLNKSLVTALKNLGINYKVFARRENIKSVKSLIGNRFVDVGGVEKDGTRKGLITDAAFVDCDVIIAQTSSTRASSIVGEGFKLTVVSLHSDRDIDADTVQMMFRNRNGETNVIMMGDTSFETTEDMIDNISLNFYRWLKDSIDHVISLQVADGKGLYVGKAIKQTLKATKAARDTRIVELSKDGLSQREIAAEINCSVGTVSSVLKANIISPELNKFFVEEITVEEITVENQICVEETAAAIAHVEVIQEPTVVNSQPEDEISFDENTYDLGIDLFNMLITSGDWTLDQIANEFNGQSIAPSVAKQLPPPSTIIHKAETVEPVVIAPAAIENVDEDEVVGVFNEIVAEYKELPMDFVLRVKEIVLGKTGIMTADKTIASPFLSDIAENCIKYWEESQQFEFMGLMKNYRVK